MSPLFKSILNTADSLRSPTSSATSGPSQKADGKWEVLALFQSHFLDQYLLNPPKFVEKNESTLKFNGRVHLAENILDYREFVAIGGVIAQETSGLLLQRFLNTPKPAGPKLSEKWLAEDDAQRKACGLFWEQTRQRHRSNLLRLKIGTEDIEYDLKILSADSEPKHVLFAETQRKEILTKIAARNAAKSPMLPGPIQPQCSPDPLPTFRAPETKLKTKTCKQNTEPPLENLAVLDNVLSDEPEDVKVEVTKQHLYTLQSLFPTRNYEERTRSVHWTAF